jgi:hypothetical protein
MLVVREGKEDYSSLYKYLTVTNAEGDVVPYEATTLEELDAQVELMLNGDYKKKDFVVLQVVDYAVIADLA